MNVSWMSDVKLSVTSTGGIKDLLDSFSSLIFFLSPSFPPLFPFPLLLISFFHSHASSFLPSLSAEFGGAIRNMKEMEGKIHCFVGIFNLAESFDIICDFARGNVSSSFVFWELLINCILYRTIKKASVLQGY